MERKINYITEERISPMKNPVITIVVPVYNIEKYIDRCISSILNQSYKDFELILVDDGCTDNSGTICDNYAEKDSRVQVIHKPNGGVSSARNKGIDEARGKYICFIDSDDWVEPTYLQNFMDADPSQYGVVLQSFYYDYEKQGKTEPIFLQDIVFEKASDLEFFLEYTDGVHNGFIWHRIFNLATIRNNHIQFPEGCSFAEDGVFFLKYISYSSNFKVISKAGYHYFLRAASLTSRGKQLPRQTYIFVLENIANSTNLILKRNDATAQVANGLRAYTWRLMYGWLLERTLHSFDDFCEIHDYFLTFSHEYHIDNKISGLTIIERSIIKGLLKDSSINRYNEICLLMKLRNFECHLIRIVKRIKCLFC